MFRDPSHPNASPSLPAAPRPLNSGRRSNRPVHRADNRGGLAGRGI